MALTRLANNREHLISLLENLIVPKSQHPVTLCHQPCVSLFIVCCYFQMLTSIAFDNQAFLKTNEIDNIISYGLLSSEF